MALASNARFTFINVVNYTPDPRRRVNNGAVPTVVDGRDLVGALRTSEFTIPTDF